MKCGILFILFLTTCFNLSGQVTDSLNQEVAPKGGLQELAVRYFGIDFTKEQREQIEGVEIEMVFLIDENGKPTLSEVNGTTDQAIKDSLRLKTAQIDPFYPRIRNGIAEPTIYFLKLTFPSHQDTEYVYFRQQVSVFNAAEIKDFEYIKESGSRFDMTLGGVVNKFFGSPSNHLGIGGGMKIDIGYAGKNNLNYGMNMSFYGNKLTREYPLSTTREQFNAPPTLLLGLVFGKWFDRISIQGELNFAVQNVTENKGRNDPEWVQLRGWSPGLVIHYPVKLGSSNTAYFYGSPTLLENNLNFHFGFRYIKLSLTEATGFMAEFGVSYRLTIRGVNEYKLREDLPGI